MSKGQHTLEKFAGLRKRTKVGIVAALVLPLVATGTVAANAITEAEWAAGVETGHPVKAKWFDVCVSPEGRGMRFILQGQTCGAGSIELRWPGSEHPNFAPPEQGEPGQDGVSGYEVFTSVQDFGPGGIGGAWCGAPDANTEDQGWRVIGGGATLSPDDVNAGVVVVSGWPNLSDPLNPGWNVQLNKPTNVDPGDVELYAVCAKVAG